MQSVRPLTHHKIAVLCAAGTCLLGSSLASAAQLYRNEMASGAGWGVNASSGDSAATFGYDYSADGIPEAPNSMGGDSAQRGVKLEANLTAGALDVFALYPVGENFTGDYRLRFDAWMNYDADERINGGSAGTTEFIGGGVSYDNVASDVGTGVELIATGDGGSGSDWRAFNDGTFLDPADMVAGDRNGFNAYYSDFLPGVAPPAGQAQTDFPPGVAGSPGFQWITFEFIVFGDSVRINIQKPNGDRLPIVNVDTTSTDTDGNIALYYADYFSSVTSRPDLTFGLIDNVSVDTNNLPEPASLALLGVGGLFILRRRRSPRH